MSETNSTQKYLSVDEALDKAPSRPKLDEFWKVILNCFFVFYLFVILTWFLDESPLRNKLIDLTWKPMAAFGWYQSWSLFSPDVRHVIYHETAVITFEDGSTKMYEFPRTSEMSQIERFRREKLRKMYGDCMPWPGYAVFLPMFARHLAYSNANPENPPKLVTFIFNMATNPPPDGPNFVMRDNLPKHTQKVLTFVYQVPEKEIDASNKMVSPESNTGGEAK